MVHQGKQAGEPMGGVKGFLKVLLLAPILAVSLLAVEANAESSARVLNGQSASGGAWPWMVSLYFTNSTPAAGHFCGAVLIAPRYLLTAGHCVADYKASPSTISASIGRTRLTQRDGLNIEIDGVILHPQYEYGMLKNDLALARLKSPVDLPPISLSSPSNGLLVAPGEVATLLGWGSMDAYYSVKPDNLQQAQIPIVSDSDCESRLGLDFDVASMMCGGVLASNNAADDGVDACYGDSGGPLMVQSSTGWKVVGVVSWGFTCGHHRYWGVYSKTTPNYDWINSFPDVAPYTARPPLIRGSTMVGNRLTCSSGKWSGDPTITLSYEWFDSRRGAIAGAARKTLKLVRRNLGRTIKCRVTASNQGGITISNSKRVGPIALPRSKRLTPAGRR